MRFPATIELNGKSATGIQVPPGVLTALDAGKRPKVPAPPSTPARHPTAALMAALRATDFFRYNNQRRHVMAVEGAKTDATRRRRIEKCAAELGG
jgi:hypothetical protein